MTAAPLPVALIVEDEPQIRRFVRAALEAQHWQVVEARTLNLGLSEAATRRPALARPIAPVTCASTWASCA